LTKRFMGNCQRHRALCRSGIWKQRAFNGNGAFYDVRQTKAAEVCKK